MSSAGSAGIGNLLNAGNTLSAGAGVGLTPAGPWLRRLVITLGPLEEWRGLSRGEVVRFEGNGTPFGLRVSASLEKILMGVAGPSCISVTNLARDTREAIRANLTKITVQAGHTNEELELLFQGSVLSVTSGRSGTDIVTRIQAVPGYGALVRGMSSRTFSNGMPLRDAVAALASDLPGLRLGELTGITGTFGAGGWSFAGTTRDGLTQLAEEYGFSWHVVDGAFHAVGDRAAIGGVLELSGDSGGLLHVSPLLADPTQVRTGVNIRALFQPGVEPGRLVRVRSTVSPGLNGDYRVHTLRLQLDSHGGEWGMDMEAFSLQEGA